MALDLSSASYGRSQETTQAVIDNYRTYFQSVKNALNGQEKEAFINAIKNSWEGTDAGAYVSRLNARINEINQFIDKLPIRIENAINEDLRQFQNFQDTNAGEFAAGSMVVGAGIGSIMSEDVSATTTPTLSGTNWGTISTPSNSSPGYSGTSGTSTGSC